MAFTPQYWTGAAWASIPDAALTSTYGGTYHVEYPKANKLDGQGNPCGAFGNPDIVIEMAWMDAVGMAFWVARLGLATVESATLDIKVWNERTGASASLSGKLGRPSHAGQGVGNTTAQTVYRNVRIVIHNCVASAH